MEKDLVIIGSGPGGYIAAIECAKNGRTVTIIEKANLGGICLNFGCMPTKALLHSAKEILGLKNAIKNGKIDAIDFKINYSKIINSSRESISKIRDGLSFLMTKNKIEVINATACFKNDKEVELTYSDNSKDTITFNDLIIATGSTPRELPNIKVNGKNVHSSKTFLTNETMPKNALVIGSGAIGLEFASFLNALGVKVTILEALDKVMPQADSTISNTLKRLLQDRGITIFTSASITKFENINDDIINITFTDKKGVENSLTFDTCIASVGVIPNTKNIGLENTSVNVTERGFIIVDNKMKTTASNIYAIGDVVGAPTLAHVASREALIASHAICNIESNLNKDVIPYGTYSFPQVASVGLTEEQAKEKGLNYKSVRLPFAANGKAVVSESEEGLIKLIFDADTRKILGCHIIQEDAVELITEIVLAINNNLTLDDITKTIHSHPTLSEAISDVCNL